MLKIFLVGEGVDGVEEVVKFLGGTLGVIHRRLLSLLICELTNTA